MFQTLPCMPPLSQSTLEDGETEAPRGTPLVLLWGHVYLMGLEDRNCGALWRRIRGVCGNSRHRQHPRATQPTIPQCDRCVSKLPADHCDGEKGVPGGSWRPHLDLNIKLTRTHDQERLIQTHRVYIFWDTGDFVGKRKTQVFDAGFGEEWVDSLRSVSDKGQAGGTSMACVLGFCLHDLLSQG